MENHDRLPGAGSVWTRYMRHPSGSYMLACHSRKPVHARNQTLKRRGAQAQHTVRAIQEESS